MWPRTWGQWTLPEGGSQGLENTDKGFFTENMIKVFLRGYTHHQTQNPYSPFPVRFRLLREAVAAGFPLFPNGGIYCSSQDLLCQALSQNIIQAEPLCGLSFSRCLRWFSSMCLTPLSQSPSPVLLPHFCSWRVGTAGKVVFCPVFPYWSCQTQLVHLQSFFPQKEFLQNLIEG